MATPVRPRIGITVHVGEEAAPQGHRETRFALGARYAQAVLEAGGLPLLLPTHPEAAAPAEAVLAAIDGLLLSGGGPLPPGYFALNPEPSLQATNPGRYQVEAALVRSAAALGKPLLGICRGQQTMVEALGGELLRDLTRHPGALEHDQALPPWLPSHALRVEPGSRLAGWVGPRAQVNSFHRQAVRSAPSGWRVSAWADDGLVEAVEAERGFMVGLQFHPEWLGQSEPGFRALFTDFVAATRAAATAT